MIGNAVQALVALLEALLPQLGSASSPIVKATLDALLAWFPLIVAEYQALKPVVLNAIEALKSNGNITPEQLEALKTLSAQLDDSFDKAIAAAEAEDAGISPAP